MIDAVSTKNAASNLLYFINIMEVFIGILALRYNGYFFSDLEDFIHQNEKM